MKRCLKSPLNLRGISMSKPLIETISWRRTIWTYGFVKTTLSGSLISTGVVLIFNGVTEHPLFSGFNEIAIFTGVIAIILAIAVITSIDRYKEKTKKEELEAIDRQIDEKAKRIAEEKVLEYLREIENE